MELGGVQLTNENLLVNPEHIPQTGIKNDLKNAARAPITEFFEDLSTGMIMLEESDIDAVSINSLKEPPQAFIQSSTAYAMYLKWCGKNNCKPFGSTRFAQQMYDHFKIPAESRGIRVSIDKNRCRGFVLPLEFQQNMIVDAHRMYTMEFDPITVEQWLVKKVEAWSKTQTQKIILFWTFDWKKFLFWRPGQMAGRTDRELLFLIIIGYTLGPSRIPWQIFSICPTGHLAKIFAPKKKKRVKYSSITKNSAILYFSFSLDLILSQARSPHGIDVLIANLLISLTTVLFDHSSFISHHPHFLSPSSIISPPVRTTLSLPRSSSLNPYPLYQSSSLSPLLTFI